MHHPVGWLRAGQKCRGEYRGGCARFSPTPSLVVTRMLQRRVFFFSQVTRHVHIGSKDRLIVIMGERDSKNVAEFSESWPLAPVSSWTTIREGGVWIKVRTNLFWLILNPGCLKAR